MALSLLTPVMLSVLRASYTTSLPEHISELMPLYLDPS